MRNYYYIFWVDSILRFQKHNPDKNWKVSVFFMNSWVQGVILWMIVVWGKYFDLISFELYIFNIFPGSMLNKFFSYSIVFVSPFLLINYFLILHNDRYKKLIKKYPQPEKNFALIFTISVLFLGLITVFLYGGLTS